jgi:uncharacterized membrane protein YcaP (DUF421 family)
MNGVPCYNSSVVPFIFLWLSLTPFSRKELSQLNTTDVILILLISNSFKCNGRKRYQFMGGLATSVLLALILFWNWYKYQSSDFMQEKPDPDTRW